METPKEYHYTYYSYEEYGRGYFGSRTCECLPEEDMRYFGSFSDKTFKPTQKIILKSDYTTRVEADADEILLHNYFEVDINPHFANRSRQTSTKFRLPRERAIEIGRMNGAKSKELGLGVHGLTKEQMTENGKKGAQKAKELGVGIHAISKEQRIENSKKGVRKAKELEVGIFAMTEEELSKAGKKGGKISGQKNKENKTGYMGRTKEQMTEDGKKGAQKVQELGIGIFALTSEELSASAKKAYANGLAKLPKEVRSEIGRRNGRKRYEDGTGCFSLTPEQKSELAKRNNAQKWMCLETGYVSNSGGLSRYQKAKGIDTSKRKRIS
jgi:general stress protein YciG